MDVSQNDIEKISTKKFDELSTKLSNTTTRLESNRKLRAAFRLTRCRPRILTNAQTGDVLLRRGCNNYTSGMLGSTDPAVFSTGHAASRCWGDLIIQ